MCWAVPIGSQGDGLAGLYARIDVADSHGGDYTEHPSPAGWTIPKSIPCYSQGPFVEVLWVYPTGATNRLAEMREKIRQAVAATDLLFRVSAAAVTDGSGKAGIRAVRWAMDAGCKLQSEPSRRVRSCTTTSPWRMTSYSGAWSPILRSTSCWPMRVSPRRHASGSGGLWQDDRPEAWNLSNGGGTLAYIYPSCFDYAYDIADAPAYLAHELMHTLGAVQHSAPHSTGEHCWDDPAYGFDGADIMCYDDHGVDISYFYSRCPSTYPETFDCGKDDYFNPFPAASSYLATHWNTARNIYLSTTNATTFDLIAGASLAPFTDIPWTTFENDIIWLYNVGHHRRLQGDHRTAPTPRSPGARWRPSWTGPCTCRRPAPTTSPTTTAAPSRRSINRLAAAGITKGCTATTFCPTANVTRGQMAAFLDRALHLPATSTDYFTDDNSTTFEGNINRLAASGITKGCTPTTFCPNPNVTRGQMAAFLHRALG